MSLSTNSPSLEKRSCSSYNDYLKENQTAFDRGYPRNEYNICLAELTVQYRQKQDYASFRGNIPRLIKQFDKHETNKAND